MSRSAILTRRARRTDKSLAILTSSASPPSPWERKRRNLFRFSKRGNHPLLSAMYTCCSAGSHSCIDASSLLAFPCINSSLRHILRIHILFTQSTILFSIYSEKTVHLCFRFAFGELAYARTIYLPLTIRRTVSTIGLRISCNRNRANSQISSIFKLGPPPHSSRRFYSFDITRFSLHDRRRQCCPILQFHHQHGSESMKLGGHCT